MQPILVSPEDWRRRENELFALREFKAEQDRKAEQAEAERVKLLTDKGQIEEAYKLQQARFDKKLTEVETRNKLIETEWLAEKSSAAITAALAGKQLTGADPNRTAEMLRTLLGAEIEAVLGENGKPVVRDRRTMRAAEDYLKERLESPELAIFFAATNKGGAGTDAGRPAAATPPTPASAADARNKAFAEDFLRRQAAAQQARF